jgi:lipoprotein-anchoring transpeptidase ErfK/SrfK
MLHRRSFFMGAIASIAMPVMARAHSTNRSRKTRKFKLDPEYIPQQVEFTGHPPGTLVIDPANKFLYLVEDEQSARRYGVGVGRAGLTFKGSALVGRKAKWPSWRPTKNMIRRDPRRYARYSRGVPGGLRNPLGARALYLYRDGRDTYYRIHGTNDPTSIGQSRSAGCIRMLNEHVSDLYTRVPVGTPVIVL